MNIPELKKAMDLVAFFTANDAEYPVLRDDLKKVLDACQLLCDTSDKMLPKMERNTPIAENVYNNGEVKGYNKAREEDILWLSKKLMGIEEIILQDNPYTGYSAKSGYVKKIATAIIQSFGLNKEG